MNKEQILGRLLMDGDISLDELSILNKNDFEDNIRIVKQEPIQHTTNVTQKKEQETKGMFDWLDKFRYI